MPEGPELHLASLYVNRMCDGVVFAGAVRKSEVSKNPEVPFTCEAYRITAASRGKEVKLTLTPIKSDGQRGKAVQPVDIVFRFGMSGYFRFTSEDEVPKHAHLQFHTKEKPCRVLSFVDARRFGSWQPNGTWQPDRGPCIMFEYQSFRENVLSNLSDRAFDRPICEVLLNQKYFNGIGNYLRAEILFRLNIPPFVPARGVLESLGAEDLFKDEKPLKNAATKGAKKKEVKQDAGDLLRLCHTVPLEVISLGGKGYDPEKSDYSAFQAWLQCYYVDGMKSIRDHNGRTMWFKGDPGPMAPKNSKSPQAKKRIKKEDDHDYTTKKKKARNQSESTTKKKAVKEERVIKENKEQAKEVVVAKGKRGKTQEASTPMTRTRSSARQIKTNTTEPAGDQKKQAGKGSRKSRK
ncbi:endonuclease 8-like 1 isoform X1 [Oryzias melastigma]|uniref:Endonuclease 8-like 1 n=1 Tax=Oryzias melastigma TaxID=30732 RepID=A0A3B3BHS0_ORYME|nr:endonuclease 8-like 1 isoform X1 [Oryzias melastigma]XP_024119538.1 endonuclease 8-like 1 isoform X1 [Oryzias melastigma]XP_024119539.1 endonuclease 8-like 1 isoform X1 [Oryzias melastigma]XP_024119540.1 endonuclease 8-like 1 isoform X1 [Oryzias melastigma]